jgi:hypothetical protein
MVEESDARLRSGDEASFPVAASLYSAQLTDTHLHICRHTLAENQRLTLEVVNREHTFNVLFKSTPTVGVAGGGGGNGSSSPRGSAGRSKAATATIGGSPSRATSSKTSVPTSAPRSKTERQALRRPSGTLSNTRPIPPITRQQQPTV